MTQDGDQGGAARRRSSRRSRLPRMPMFLNCPPNPPYTNYMDEEPTLKPWKPRKLSNRDKYDYSWITKSSRKKCLTGLRYLTMDELRDQKTGYNLKPRKAKDAEDEAECFATQFVTIPVPKYPPKQTEEDDQGQEADNISSAFFWDQGQGEPPNDIEKGFDKQPADADFAAFAAENASAGSCSSKSAECCEEEEQTQDGNNAVQQFNFEGQGFEGAAAPFKQPFSQGQGQPFAEKNVAQFSNKGPCANQGQPFNVDQFAFQGQNVNQGQFANQGQPFNGGAPNFDQFAFQGQNANQGKFSNQGQPFSGGASNFDQFAFQGQNANRDQFANQGQPFNGGASNFDQFAFQGQNVNRGQFANQGQPFNGGASNFDQFAFQGQNVNRGQFANQGQPFNGGASNFDQFAFQGQNQGQFAFQGQPFAPNIDKFLSPPGPRTPQGQAGSARPGEFICCMCQQKFLCSKVSDNFGMIQH